MNTSDVKKQQQLFYSRVSLTLFKGWIAEEEVVTASGRCLLTPVRFEHGIELVADLVKLIEDGKHTFVDELVWVLLTQVVLALQVGLRCTLYEVIV